jgi:sugar transferase (PEP-CTERM/EpsH1 system associated)
MTSIVELPPPDIPLLIWNLLVHILYIVPYMPNLIRVRPYNLIRYLSERGHQVTLLTLYESEAEQAEAKALEAYCHQVIALPLPRWRSLWNCLLTLPTRKPLQTAYCWQPALSQQLQEIVSGKNSTPSIDIIHIEHLRGVRYGLHLQNHQNGDRPYLPIVWDSVDCISHLFRQAAASSQSQFGRWMTRLELGRTELFERQLLHQFNHLLVTSPLDKQAFLSLAANNHTYAPVSVLPNGVDLTYFQPDEKVQREKATLVVSGKMSYHANITMTHHLMQAIMPHIWAKRPDVKLWIVGKDPPHDIQAFNHHPNVTVTGTVADIRPYLQQATIAVAPITYGAGIQNKVLEAMACATPVVTTPQTISALTAVPDRDLLVATDAETFSQSVMYLLDNSTKAKAIGAAGRTYIEEHHNWAGITAQLEDIYFGIIG